MFLAGWIFAAIIVGIIGTTRKMGFTVAFFASLVLSPIVALIFLAFDKKKDDPGAAPALSVSDELSKLFSLKESGALTPDEYENQKASLLKKKK